MDETLKLACSECTYTATSSEDLSAHQSSSHSTIFFKPCKRPNCSSRFRSKRELSAHLVAQHNYIPCRETRCQKVFQHGNRMERHWASHKVRQEKQEEANGAIDREREEWACNAEQLTEETFRFLRNVLRLCGPNPIHADAFRHMTSALISGMQADNSTCFPISLCMHAMELARSLPPTPSPPPDLPIPEVTPELRKPPNPPNPPHLPNPPANGLSHEPPPNETPPINGTMEREEAPIEKKKRGRKRRRESLSTTNETAPGDVAENGGRQHRRRTTRQTLHVCQDCGESFSTRSELSRHISTDHAEEKGPSEPLIVKEETKEVELGEGEMPGQESQTIALALNPGQLPLLCIEPPCPMRFRTPKELLEHVESVHYNSKQCP